MKVPFLLILLFIPSEAFITYVKNKNNDVLSLFSSTKSNDYKQNEEVMSYRETTETAKPMRSETQKLKLEVEQFAVKTDFALSSPAEYENSKFQCDDNVYFWRDYNREGLYETEDFIKEINDVSNRFLRKGGEAVNYWIRHSLRTGYFSTNAVLGVLTSQFLERIRSQEVHENSFTGNLATSATLTRLVAEALLAYEQDYDRIVSGKFKLPYDMYSRNRQNSPFFITRQTARFINEAVGTVARRNRGSEEDKRIWISNVKSKIYPDYYKTAFHYQTNGWMSPDSANVYETSTETLFLGRQDAMQRTAMVPLVQFANEFHESSDSGRPIRVLEVGCGTGRFMTFARDNLPLNTDFTAVDLSPFYLNNARENDQNWISIRQRIEAESRNEEIKIAPATFVQAKGEDLPFEDEEFDAVVCMFMYHEIPRDIRAQVSSEMARVTKKGGKVILTDSIQLGDRPGTDNVIGNFEKMNEPYYKDYIEDFLPEHFEKVGLECDTKTSCSSTKTLAFDKPSESSTSSALNLGTTLHP